MMTLEEQKEFNRKGKWFILALILAGFSNFLWQDAKLPFDAMIVSWFSIYAFHKI